MELPRLQPLFEKYADRGFNVVAIEARRDREGAEKFIEENGLTYTMLENGEGEADVVSGIFGVRGFPTSFLVDENGRIVSYHLGFSAGDEKHLEEEILLHLGG